MLHPVLRKTKAHCNCVFDMLLSKVGSTGGKGILWGRERDLGCSIAQSTIGHIKQGSLVDLCSSSHPYVLHIITAQQCPTTGSSWRPQKLNKCFLDA